ncbi:unnamed protein product [Polarella glacialis]|uniref:Uncharacterized protein n=1 Tax=Polarella glacialis TaxID=89957 RepID=A0A813L5J4_POLGL|nr:unnamed protein product [Polarella glacialis]
MQQVGAALTDWSVSIASFLTLLVLYRKSCGRQHVPRWYRCLMGVYLSEGNACFGGGFMWASGINKRAHHLGQLTLGQHAACCLMVLGMVAEGLCLILTSRALLRTSEEEKSSFISWAWPEAAAFAACCGLHAIGCLTSVSVTTPLQFLGVLAVGLAFFWCTCFKIWQVSGNAAERSCWSQLLGGATLNLIGAALLGMMDNDCTGLGCITELLPWESSPCRFGIATPPGSSCPLPEWFNHAAVMHVLAVVSCVASVPALCKLLDLSWEPHAGKSHTQ